MSYTLCGSWCTFSFYSYLTKENIVMTQADYDCIMPDYYRMAYYS